MISVQMINLLACIGLGFTLGTIKELKMTKPKYWIVILLVGIIGAAH